MSQATKDEFLKYKPSDSADIEAEGVSAFFDDLGIDPMDPVTLVISFYMQAEEMGTYKQKEFCEGLIAMGCETVPQLRSRTDSLRKELNEKT